MDKTIIYEKFMHTIVSLKTYRIMLKTTSLLNPFMSICQLAHTYIYINHVCLQK